MALPLPPNSLLLEVKGYLLPLKDLSYFSSDLLFSWKQSHGVFSSARWGAHSSCDTKVWMTEFAYANRNEIVHEFPGAFLQAFPCTQSSRTITYVWKNMHSKYTYKPREIYPQSEAREYLESIIDGDTRIYHRGGFLEKVLADLCGAKDVVNTGQYGVEKIRPDQSRLDGMHCKVHKRGSVHCCLSEVVFYLKSATTWAFAEEEEEEEEEEAKKSWGEMLVEEDNM